MSARIDGMSMVLQAFRSNPSLKFNPNSDQELVCLPSYWDGFDVTGKKLTLKVISVNDKLYFLFETFDPDQYSDGHSFIPTPETQILCPSIGIVEEYRGQNKIVAKKRLLCGFLKSQDGVAKMIEYDIPHEKYDGKEQKIDAFLTSMQMGENSQCKIKCTTSAFHTDEYYLYTPEHWPTAPHISYRLKNVQVFDSVENSMGEFRRKFDVWILLYKNKLVMRDTTYEYEEYEREIIDVRFMHTSNMINGVHTASHLPVFRITLRYAPNQSVVSEISKSKSRIAEETAFYVFQDSTFYALMLLANSINVNYPSWQNNQTITIPADNPDLNPPVFRECCICLDKKAVMMLKPCGHVCMCTDCFEDPRVIQNFHHKCPRCRAKFSVGYNVQEKSTSEIKAAGGFLSTQYCVQLH